MVNSVKRKQSRLTNAIHMIPGQLVDFASEYMNKTENLLQQRHASSH